MSPESQPETPETPEPLKWLAWAHHHFIINREALTKPPVIIFVILGICFGYWLGSNRESEMISVKNERIGLLTDQITAYRERLNGATPDEAAKHVMAIQAELEAYKKKFDTMFPELPRKLTLEQSKILISYKDRMLKFKKPLKIYASEIGESDEYAKIFIDFFKGQGIPTLDLTNAECYVGQRGVLVGLKDPTKPSVDADDFVKILKAASIDPHTTLWGMTPDQNTLDFDLFICPAF